MTTLIPNSQASGVEAYEDMFKEITKKLYGEEASQSLQTPMTHATADADRSFTNLVRVNLAFVCRVSNDKYKFINVMHHIYSYRIETCPILIITVPAASIMLAL